MPKYLMVIILLISSIVSAQENVEKPMSVFLYDILSEGKEIGNMSVQISSFPNFDYVILQKSHIQISEWWGDVDLRSTLIEETSKEGKLLRFDNKTLEGNEAYWTKIETSDEELWGSYTQVKNITEKEEEEFVGMAVAATSNLVAGLGEIMAISELLFAERKSPVENIRFSQNAYDTTLTNFPFYWEKENQKLSRKMRILDSESLFIYEMKVEDLGSENIEIGASSISTHHYKMIPEEGSSLDIWLAMNHQKQPYLVQLIGDDQYGPFKIKFKK